MRKENNGMLSDSCAEKNIMNFNGIKKLPLEIKDCLRHVKFDTNICSLLED